MLRILLCLLFLFNWTLPSFADHPNEGVITIEELMQEALKNNLELKQLDENIKAAEFDGRKAYGALLPEISIEGGPQMSRFGAENNDGASLYGKAEWNLYRGGADLASIQLALNKRDLELKRRKNLEIKIRNEISRLYYETLFILESIALKEEALKMNENQKKLATVKNNAGFTSKTDVLEFELREASLNSDLILLTQELLEKNKALKVLLSREDNQSSTVAVKGHLLRTKDSFDRESLKTKMEHSNPDLQEIHSEKKSLEIEKKMVNSEYYPSIDIEGKYGKLADEEKVYQEPNNYTIALKLSVPIFSGLKTTNSHRSIQSSIGSKGLTIEQKHLELLAELDNAINKFKTIERRLDLEEKNLKKSTEYYNNTVNEYKRGVKNSPDMVGASERLLETRLRNLEYRRDLAIERLKIISLTGD